MPLDIFIQRSATNPTTHPVTITLKGSLDTATAPELEEKIKPILAATGIKDLVFDLAGLNFISSAGLRVFSVARKALKEHGGQASFLNMQAQIQEVFQIMEALPGVAVFASVAELDEYLAARQRIITEGS